MQTIHALIEEAVKLNALGIPLFLSDPRTKEPIGDYSEYNPILDLETIKECCEANPSANLEIVIDSGIVALGVGVGQWAQNGNRSFAELCERHGTPDTVAYQNPDGRTYYIFKGAPEYDPAADSGIGFTRVGRLAVYPSTVDGKPVKTVGASTTIRNFTDWIAPSGGNKTPEGVVTEAPEGIETGINLAEVTSTHVSSPKITDRNVVAVLPHTALQGKIEAWAAEGLEQAQILANALAWNEAAGKPLNTSDIVALVEKLQPAAPSQAAEEAPTGKSLLMELAKDIIPFHDEKSEPYFFMEGEAFKAPSKHVADRLRYLYMQVTKQLPPKFLVKEVLDLLESKARFEGEQITLTNRVSARDGVFYYDMRNGQYLKMTPEKWEIVPADSPLFRRYQHMQPQVLPVRGGNPWRIFDFLTVEEESRLLVMVYIISLFIPRIAHPVFALFGEQGAAKSFFSTVINRLVDPSLTERIIQPKNERDLMQTVRQKYLTVFDNLSKIGDRYSDIFCQVCTGGSISLRQLYTDEGENIAQFRHVIILNSISLAIVNADLMDRSIILKLQRIKPEERKPEQDLWDEFEAVRPEILGGIFDTVVKAMNIYSTLKIQQLPRLADFAKWGYAIAEALGHSGAQFLDDFTQNVKRQNESVVEKNVLCQAVLRLMADKPTFLKSVGDAHAALKAIAGQDHKDATFPKLPQNLRGGLDLLRSTLEEHGITYQYLDRQRAGVQVLFSKVATQGSPDPNITLNTAGAHSGPSAGVADVADEPEGETPTFEIDEEPEVVNG